MGHHEPVDAVLPALRPLAIVFPNNIRAIPKNIRHLLERRSLFTEPSCERVPVTVGMGVLDTRLRTTLRLRPDRRVQESAGAANRHKAEKFYALRLADVQRGTYVKPAKGTLVEFGVQYLNFAKVNKRSWLQDEQILCISTNSSVIAS